MQQFFSLFNAFSQGMLSALLPSLFLNQIKIFRDGKINHSFVYVLQLVALAAHALVVPSFSVITIGIFSAAALSNLYGMILGDQRDETGKISQKVFDFLNFNKILMVACSLATLYTRFLAIPTVGVVSFIGFVVQLSVPISLELIDLFNIKLEGDSLFFSFKDIHQQTSLWFITYESLMMGGWRSLLVFGFAVIQNHKNVYDVFIKIKNLSPFISLNNWWHSSLYAYQRKQHPYLDQTMQLFVQTPLESATVVLKPPCEDESPTPILLSFTDQEMGVLKAIGQEKLDNAEGLFEKIAQINTELQQTAFTEQELDNLTSILGDDHQLSVKITTELNNEILERELEALRKRPKVILDFVTQVHAKIIPHAIFELRTMTTIELERLKAIDQAAYGGQEDLFRKIQAIDHESTDQQQQQGYQKTILTEPEWKTLQNILGEDDSILQKVTPQLSHDNPLYWNLSHFMKIGVKRTLMLAESTSCFACIFIK
ncbi:hypothetical protein EBR43_08120 [bacterium]|nr:hypothetical protein [bacterium]